MIYYLFEISLVQVFSIILKALIIATKMPIKINVAIMHKVLSVIISFMMQR